MYEQISRRTPASGVAIKAVAAIFTVVASLLFAGSAALAHRFDVAILAPAAGAAEEDFNAFRQGFMLATTERDAHANEESDGHLGGLDVYVNLFVETAPLGPVVLEADIVVVYSPASQAGLIMALEARGVATLLMPGEVPLEEQPGFAGFSEAYARMFNAEPTPFSAQGYHAARRIDEAVRAQSGVADPGALQASFAGTATDFSW
ncbi:MAG: hypothetical protein GXP01_00735 [Alphaproteobacteria bacterium]|nr:hypothetical protein [Alphaproteobacteria bacterium]